MRWADVMEAVAVALAEQPVGPAGGRAPAAGEEPYDSPSMLAATAAATPRELRLRLGSYGALDDAAADQVTPEIYLNEWPTRLLATGIVGAAARALAGRPELLAGYPELKADAGLPDGVPGRERVIAAVAISALSTFHLDPRAELAALDEVRRHLPEFSGPGWAAALDTLTRRTAELYGLLGSAAGARRQVWRGVSLEDRLLAEAVAAAVLGGSASASGVPAHQWLFPFHLFCRLGMTAADDALGTIERWLGIEFRPEPRTRQRSAALAVFVASEAMALPGGCRCKEGVDFGEVAYTPRGACRQADHDLGSWRPGMMKAGNRAGGQSASTLWGWLRRWLGGPDGGRAHPGVPPGRLQLRPNDVAGSVLARKWLCSDRGLDGPVLRYDRILPEFCLSCGRQAQISSRRDAAGQVHIQRACCADPQLVYQSEAILRGGRRSLKPKLGIVITSAAGRSGYTPTSPLGSLRVCCASGRYSLSDAYCPAPGCGASPSGDHKPMHHGWVLLPLGDAWADLKATLRAAPGPASTPARPPISEADLQLLGKIFAELLPGDRQRLEQQADFWESARGWSSEEMDLFRDRAGLRGLEMLFRCKEIATAPRPVTGRCPGEEGPRGLLSTSTTEDQTWGCSDGQER